MVSEWELGEIAFRRGVHLAEVEIGLRSVTRIATLAQAGSVRQRVQGDGRHQVRHYPTRGRLVGRAFRGYSDSRPNMAS